MIPRKFAPSPRTRTRTGPLERVAVLANENRPVGPDSLGDGVFLEHPVALIRCAIFPKDGTPQTLRPTPQTRHPIKVKLNNSTPKKQEVYPRTPRWNIGFLSRYQRTSMTSRTHSNIFWCQENVFFIKWQKIIFSVHEYFFSWQKSFFFFTEKMIFLI